MALELEVRRIACLESSRKMENDLLVGVLGRLDDASAKNAHIAIVAV